jgi:hypothetical protein
MISFEQGPPSWLTGRSKPPTWYRIFVFLLMLGLIIALFFKRGIVVGVVAAVVYGYLALVALLRWDWMTGWSKRHPTLDRLLFIPLLFLTVAYISKIPTLICVLIAVLGGLLMVGIISWVRSRAMRSRA